MIFGKTNIERSELEYAKIVKKAAKNRKEKERIKDLYHKCFKTFAWIPVYLSKSGQYAWLRTVYYHYDIEYHTSHYDFEGKIYSFRSKVKFYYLEKPDLIDGVHRYD